MESRKILTSQAIPGMIVAADVYTKDNHLIIAKGTTMTDKIITRLVFYSIIEISVYSDNDPKETDPWHNLSQDTGSYYENIKKSEAFQRFHQAYRNNVLTFKDSLDSFVKGNKELEADKLFEDTKQILEKCNTNIEIFNMLHCMRQYDDTTYVHSLNVALISNIIGKWLGYSNKDLEVLTLCGLLHDLGKLMIPAKIITKPGKLTDEEFRTVKTHTIRGYNLLKSKPLDIRIKHAALMHHERCDGSGYPYGFYSEQIDPFAKLVSIADVYDAMTCARVYRGPLCPFEVISVFESEGYSKYDPQFIMTFLEGITQTYIHNSVQLSNGVNGEIIFINKMELSRPVVKVGEEYIDLSKHKELQIMSLV